MEFDPADIKDDSDEDGVEHEEPDYGRGVPLWMYIVWFMMFLWSIQVIREILA